MDCDDLEANSTYYFLQHQTATGMRVLIIFQMVLGRFLNGLLALAGTVANGVNVVVFSRQGVLSDSCTPCLVSLAVSDFLHCLTGLTAGVLTAVLQNATDYVTAFAMETLISFLVEMDNLFAHISCWVTAVLALERAISVVLPFRAKFLLTPKLSVCAMAGVYVVTIVLLVAIVFEYVPGYTHDTLINTTVMTSVSAGFPYSFVMLGTFFLFAASRPASVALVAVCNVILIWKVATSRRFRKKATTTPSEETPAISGVRGQGANGGKDDALQPSGTRRKQPSKSTKETKLLRMALIISIVFCLCYIPDLLVYALVLETADLTVLYLREISTFLEMFNSSYNIVVYYVMSSKFRQELNSCCCGKRNP